MFLTNRSIFPGGGFSLIRRLENAYILGICQDFEVVDLQRNFTLHRTRFSLYRAVQVI